MKTSWLSTVYLALCQDGIRMVGTISLSCKLLFTF